MSNVIKFQKPITECPGIIPSHKTARVYRDFSSQAGLASFAGESGVAE